MKEYFSKRQGIADNKKAPIFEGMPEKMRVGLWNLIEDYTNHKSLPAALPSFNTLYTKMTKHFRIRRSSDPNCLAEVEDMVLNSFRWHELLDMIEVLFTQVFYYDYDERENEWSQFPNKIGDARYQYTKDINSLLSSENMGWKLRKGQLERIGSDILDQEIVGKARSILQDPDFAGPNRQFIKSLDFFNKRPLPDLENCIKDAVGALEGLARILLHNKHVTLGKAVDILVEKGTIRKPFDKTFHALYGFVSTEPGSRHGAIVLSSIDIPETEFVLYNSAVCINFLASKFGHKVASNDEPSISTDEPPNPEGDEPSF